jgi:hypothetical protein
MIQGMEATAQALEHEKILVEGYNPIISKSTSTGRASTFVENVEKVECIDKIVTAVR